MPEFLTFGEIMMRMSPPGFQRLAQNLPGSVDVTFAGAEANVAVSLAAFGADAAFVTALPDNPLTDSCLRTLTGLGVDTTQVLKQPAGRMGIYFVENGANQRPTRVVYDRSGSTISVTPSTAYNWPDLLTGVRHLHLTGITPALSEHAFEATRNAAMCARESGISVSCDYNFRSMLWNWRPHTNRRRFAAEVMRDIVPSVEILFANAGDCRDLMGDETTAPDASFETEARRLARQYPNLKLIASTLRENVSASHNNWGATLLDVTTDRILRAPETDGVYRPYEIRNIVDRVGGGDAFAAGLLFARNCDDFPSPQQVLEFATAASCLAHSVSGDFNFTSRDEVELLMNGASSGRVVR